MPEGAANFTAKDIQILVSTMNRESLDFLESMFPFTHFSGFSIIVVNQGSSEHIVTSPYASVKVVNTPTRGLSVSRNIALDNATGKLCVIADDDVVFERNFQEHIFNAFVSFPVAAAITFQYNRPERANPVKSYAQRPFAHTIASARGVSSIEMVLNREMIKAAGCRFNANFGLGATFEIAEEFLLLRSIILQDLQAYYYPAAIVTHGEWSSGRDHGNDRLVYARAALACKLYGGTAGLWLLKYMQFLVRKRLIAVTDVPQKFKTGMEGIKKYKTLLNEGKETRQS